MQQHDKADAALQRGVGPITAGAAPVGSSSAATQRCKHGQQLVQRGGVLHHQRARLAVAHDEGQLLQAAADSPNSICRAAQHDGLVRQQPSGAVFADQGHAVAPLEAQGGQPRCQLLSLRCQLSEGELGRRVLVGVHQCHTVAVLCRKNSPELGHGGGGRRVASGQQCRSRKGGHSALRHSPLHRPCFFRQLELQPEKSGGIS